MARRRLVLVACGCPARPHSSRRDRRAATSTDLVRCDQPATSMPPAAHPLPGSSGNSAVTTASTAVTTAVPVPATASSASTRGIRAMSARRRASHAASSDPRSTAARRARTHHTGPPGPDGGNVWVPASVHPEISPAEFKLFVAAQAERAQQREKEFAEDAPTPLSDEAPASPAAAAGVAAGVSRKPSRRATAAVGPSGELDPALSGLIRKKSLSHDQHLRADLITRSTSLTRRASHLRSQFDPDAPSAPTHDDSPPPRKSREAPALTAADLAKLERFTERASRTNDTVALRHALHRTISLSSQSSAFDRVDDIPPVDEEPRRSPNLPVLSESLAPAFDEGRSPSARLNRSSHTRIRHSGPSSSDGHGRDVTSPTESAGSEERSSSTTTSTSDDHAEARASTTPRASATQHSRTSSSSVDEYADTEALGPHASVGLLPSFPQGLTSLTEEPAEMPPAPSPSVTPTPSRGDETPRAPRLARGPHGPQPAPAPSVGHTRIATQLPAAPHPSLSAKPAAGQAPASKTSTPAATLQPPSRPNHERSQSMPLPAPGNQSNFQPGAPSGDPLGIQPGSGSLGRVHGGPLRRIASPSPSQASTSSKRKARSGFASWFGRGGEEDRKAEQEAKKAAKAERKRDKEREKEEEKRAKEREKEKEKVKVREKEKEKEEKEREREREREKEKEKEKDDAPRFLGLFSKKKHNDEAKPVQWNPAGRRPGTTGPGGKPMPTPPRGIGVDYYSRFPIPIERAIYRLSHFKLASPKRSLCEQVLITELMYWYLGIINRPVLPPVQAGQTYAGQALEPAGAAQHLVQQIAPEHAAAPLWPGRGVQSLSNDLQGETYPSAAKTRWGIPGTQPATNVPPT